MKQLRLFTIGFFPLLAFSIFSGANGNVNANMHNQGLAARIQVCLDQRAQAGFFDDDTTFAERMEMRAQFRLCVRNAVAAHHSSMSSASSTSSAATSSSASSVSSPSSSSSSSSVSSVPAGTAVTISNFAYAPQTITVKEGTTVTWTNNDTAPHTVTRDSWFWGPNSGTLNQGQSYSFTFTKEGTFNYHCAFHPNMKGTVIVVDDDDGDHDDDDKKVKKDKKDKHNNGNHYGW